MSKFKCNKCNNNCTVILNAGVPSDCVLDNDVPCWREEITLSPEVFKLPDCPDWANYATVKHDGTIYVYRNEPVYSDGEYRHNGTGAFAPLRSVYTEERGKIVVQKEVKPILLTDKIKPGDWIYHRIAKRYEQVTYLKALTVRTVTYFEGQRSHLDWHVDQINGYFDPDPIKIKPIPECDAYKLVGKVIQDAKGNTELVMSWNVDQHKVYMDYHAVSLEELTGWWLDDKPCGVAIERVEQDDEDI